MTYVLHETQRMTRQAAFFSLQMFRDITLSILPFIISRIFLFSLFHHDSLTKHQSKMLPLLTVSMKENSLWGPSLKERGQK